MDKLFKGIVKFRQNDFEEHQDLFNDLKESQQPHTLFIGCSDSRVVPSLITNTLPGELFIIRNIGNLVPPWRQTEEYVATTSAIEYAVKILEIENIVICGHSNCGACSTLFKNPQKLENIPNVKKWLELMANVKSKVCEIIPDEQEKEAREWLAEQINIVEQIQHLLSYPFIQEKYRAGKLKIYGWYYIIETGEVFNYNKDKGYFELINKPLIDNG